MKNLGTINRGGFGRVQRMRLDDGSEVALKEFSPGPDALRRADREKLRLRFVREVRIQSSLPEEYFLPILDFDLDCETPWYTMPLAEKNLERQIAEDRRANTVSLQPLFDVLNALEELHGLECVHRDLKPQNILLQGGVWKLADFGLVLPLSEKETKFTSMESTWGSPKYCAPEQAQEFRSSNHLADIYSFGCILHDVFSGQSRVPYHRHSCDGPIGWIIEKCTELNPHKRFKSVAALRDALFSVLSEQSVAELTPASEAWTQALTTISSWSVARLEELIRYLQSCDTYGESGQIFFALDEEKLRQLHKIDCDLWSTLAQKYCEWVQGKFDFELCDLLIRRLETIFELGSFECKAAALITAVRLGVSHNRYFVMRRVVALCGPTMEERLATRVGIQIRVEEAEISFRECARRLSRPLSVYHPQIVVALDQASARTRL